MTGIVGNKWSFDQFSAEVERYPDRGLPDGLTPASRKDFMRTPLNDLARQFQRPAGTLHIQVGKIFHLDEIVEAHRLMEGEQRDVEVLSLS